MVLEDSDSADRCPFSLSDGLFGESNFSRGENEQREHTVFPLKVLAIRTSTRQVFAARWSVG